MMKKFIRARTDKQKVTRVNDILSATSRLMEKTKYENITLALIAKEAHFTRSNLYKYFKSKEEIFLEFLKHDLKLWEKDFLDNYEKEKPETIDDFVSFWVNSQIKHKRLLKLISILYIHLEKNITIDSLVSFKTQANESMVNVSNVLSKTFKNLTFEKINEFVHLQFASAIGLHQMTQLSDIQKVVLEYEEFKYFKVNFETSYEKSVRYIFESILNS